MRKTQAKMITIYDKNGNDRKIKESLKGSFIGKGYFLEKPKPKTEENPQEESK